MKYKNRKLLISFALIFSFLFQLSIPVVEASIATSLSDGVNKISEAVAEVKNITKIDVNSIRDTALQWIKGQEDITYYSQVNTIDSNPNLTAAEKSQKRAEAREYAESCSERYRSKLDEYMPQLEEVNTSIDTQKDNADKANEDKNAVLSSEDLYNGDKAGGMTDLTSSAEKMSRSQKSMMAAGKHLINVGTMLQGITNALRDLTGVIGTITSVLGCFAVALEPLGAVTSALSAVAGVLDTAVALVTALGETLCTMSEEGKTSDWEFFKTLGKEICELPKEMYANIGKDALNLITMGSSGEKFKGWFGKLAEKSSSVNTLKEAYKCSITGDIADALSSNNKCVNMVARNFTDGDTIKAAECIKNTTNFSSGKLLGLAESGIDKYAETNEEYQGVSDLIKYTNSPGKFTVDLGVSVGIDQLGIGSEEEPKEEPEE